MKTQASRRRIHRLAEQLLADHKITAPPVPIEKILRDCGAVVVAKSMQDGVSGYLYNTDGHAIIGINSFHPLVRQRFTMAHELGHLLLHKPEIHVDEQDFPVLHYRDSNSRSGENVNEREANLFAAELLMPRSMLERELKRIRDVSLHDDVVLKGLAKKFGVSGQALLIRLTSLHLLDATMFGLA